LVEADKQTVRESDRETDGLTDQQRDGVGDASIYCTIHGTILMQTLTVSKLNPPKHHGY
jgi:hypothetical protein